MMNLLGDCLPSISNYFSHSTKESNETALLGGTTTRAVAMSGTGNGDSFLRLSAVRTAAAMAKFAKPAARVRSMTGADEFFMPLQDAVTAIAGPNGALQRSAEDRWRRTGEGEGGIIGIDVCYGRGTIVYDFNCGGMFRAWVDDAGKEAMMVFREEYE